MSREDLPSIDDYIVDPESLPSVEDYITEEVDAELPSVEDYLEEEVQTIEDADGNTFAEVKDIIPPFPELIRLINDVRNDIPDIPEIKYYDKELESLTEQINQVREEIPEVRYYEAEIEAICDQIDLVKQVIEKNAADIPEIKYYDDQISVLEQRLAQVNQDIEELPQPKYYDDDLLAIRLAIQDVTDRIPTFPKWVNEVNEVPDFSWIGKTFSVIDDDFVKVHDAVEGLRGKVEYDLDRIEEHFDKKEFETRTDFNELKENINTRFDTEKEKIWKEIKETSMRMWGHHKEFKDDDRKLKKQLLGEYNLLKQTLKKDLKEVNRESVKTDELLLGYFNDLKKEISELPEVKYYDEQIDEVRDEFNDGLKSLKILVEEIKGKQEVLKEEINNRPIQPDPSESNIDPLTPTDQNFATHEDLAKHYKLFINRVQQQLYTMGGGGAGFIKDLDDVDFDQTTGTNKLLIYDGSQWVGIASTALTGSSTLNLNEVLTQGNVSGLGMSVGIITTTELHVGVDTGFFTEDLVVNGDARVTGILTVGRTSITIDGTNDQLIVGNTVIGTTDANYSGIVTAGSIVANSATFAGNITVGGTITYDDVTNVDSLGIITARTGVIVNAGGINVTGVSTFNSDVNFAGDINGNVTIVSTDSGSSAAPELTLYRNSASPAPGDYLGQIMFKGENSNGGQENYAKITGKITDETLGTEDGLIETAIKGNGSFTIVSRQRSDELQLINGVGLSVNGTSTFEDTAVANNGIEIGPNSATSIVSLAAATATTTTTSESDIDTFSATTFRSAQYQIQITRGSLYHVTTLNVLHDGTDVYLSEFGTVKSSDTSLATFDADINSGNVRVRGTPTSSDSTVFKISKTLTKV